jgi:CRP-like cAMP-binding protein
MSALLGRDELRSLFLFDALTDEQLDWLAARGERRTYDASVVVYREGDPSIELFVLLAGRVRISRFVN